MVSLKNQISLNRGIGGMGFKALRFLFAMSVCAIVIVAGTPSASAGLITYTQTGTATGTIGSTAFTDAAVTMTMVGDTANVSTVTPGTLIENAGTTTINIAGVGTATFSGDSFGVFSLSIGSTFAGFLDITHSTGILFVGTSSFYDGVSNYTHTGTGQINANTVFATTSLGDLKLTGVSGTSTFTATLGVVPEPSCLALWGLGGIGLMMADARRRLTKATA